MKIFNVTREEFESSFLKYNPPIDDFDIPDCEIEDIEYQNNDETSDEEENATYIW